jgi:Ca2+-transporting ATPase
MEQIGLQGLLIAIATCVAFYQGLPGGVVTASTMAFATLCWARLWHGFNSRGKQSIFKLGLTTNWYSIGAFAVGTILLLCILLMPIFGTAFGIAALTNTQLGWVAGLAFAPTLVIQIAKVILDMKRK